VPSENSRPAVLVQAPKGRRVSVSISFCGRSAAIEERTFSLKQQRCQLCQATETLNRHSFLYKGKIAEISIGKYSLLRQ
jgi:hypothetical protein